MIKVFIDSNVFKSEPSRLSKNFAQIAELSILGFLEIHLSSVNKDEVLSWIDESIATQQHSALEALTKAFSFKLSEAQYTKTQDLLNQTKSVFESTKADAMDDFNKWIKNSKVIIHEIDAKDGKNVMAAYFSGDKPFKNLKHRADIPDAFIWESLKRFATKNDENYFISADNNFREKVNAEFINLNCYESLNRFFESDNILKLLDDLINFTKQANTDAVIDLVKSEIALQNIDIKNKFEKIIQDYFLGNKVSPYGNNILGEISEIRFIEDPVIPIEYIKVDTSTKIYLTFDCDIEFSIYMRVPRSMNVREEFFDSIYSDSENSTDTHYSAEEYKMARVYGELLITLKDIHAGSGKDEVIEAIDDCDLVIATLRTERDVSN